MFSTQAIGCHSSSIIMVKNTKIKQLICMVAYNLNYKLHRYIFEGTRVNFHPLYSPMQKLRTPVKVGNMASSKSRNFSHELMR